MRRAEQVREVPRRRRLLTGSRHPRALAVRWSAMKPDISPDGDVISGDSTVPDLRQGSGSAANRAFVQRFRLKVIAGADAGKSLESNGERTVIGKHESADLVLTETTVSRFHCEIVVKDGRASVRDLGSRNGTLVNGLEVLHAYLRDGS